MSIVWHFTIDNVLSLWVFVYLLMAPNTSSLININSFYRIYGFILRVSQLYYIHYQSLFLVGRQRATSPIRAFRAITCLQVTNSQPWINWFAAPNRDDGGSGQWVEWYRGDKRRVLKPLINHHSRGSSCWRPLSRFIEGCLHLIALAKRG